MATTLTEIFLDTILQKSTPEELERLQKAMIEENREKRRSLFLDPDHLQPYTEESPLELSPEQMIQLEHGRTVGMFLVNLATAEGRTPEELESHLNDLGFRPSTQEEYQAFAKLHPEGEWSGHGRLVARK